MKYNPLATALPLRKAFFSPSYYLLTLLLIFFNAHLKANSWTGDTSVCQFSTESYIFNTTDTILSIGVYPGNANNVVVSHYDSISVTWGASQTSPFDIVVVYMQGGIPHADTLPVSVHALPEPVISPSGGVGCTVYVPDTGKVGIRPTESGGSITNPTTTCFQVCDSTLTSFLATGGTSYRWTVTGGTIVSSSTGDSIRVLWGNVSDSASLTLYATNSYGCMDSVTACILVIAKPNAHFTTTPMAINDTVNVCLNSPVTFIADSPQNITNWNWNFGNGTSGSGQYIVDSFSQPGNYLVSLVVVSGCHCTDTSYVWVHVDSLRGPAIFCPCTKCHNDTAVYWTNIDSCSSVFHWSVTGGTMIGDTTQDSLHVVWGNGNSGYGTVSLSTNCPSFCPYATVIEVPLVPSHATMVGDQLVCIYPPTTYTYTVPFVPSTVYTWNIPGGKGQITAGQYSNQITVQWNHTGNDSVTVLYEDIFLGCSGYTSLPVFIRGNYSIQGSQVVCQGSTDMYSAINTSSSPVNCYWSVTSPSGAVSYPSSGTSISYNFNTVGYYQIKASPVSVNSYCDTPQYINVLVLGTPPAVTDSAIHGSRTVCPYLIYTDTGTASSGSTPYILEWQAVGGSTSALVQGPTFTTYWRDTFPNWLLVRNVMIDSPYCAGPWDSIRITQATVNPAPTQYDTICVNHISHYATDSSADSYQWTLTNDSLGSIISGQGTDSINVLWNNTPGNEVIVLTRTVCGYSINDTIKVDITPVPAPVIMVNPPFCAGQAISFSTTTQGSSYVWTFGDDSTVTGSSVTHTYTNDSTYVVTLTVTDPNGCSGTSQTSEIIRVNPSPVAVLTTPDYTGCGHGYDTLYASVQNFSSIGSNLSYTWYQNGSAISDTNPVYITNIPGYYYVKISDSAGCYSYSDTITIAMDSCGTDTFPSCVLSNPSAHIWAAITRDCDSVHVDAYITTGGRITNITFENAADNAPLFSVNGASASYTYTGSGFYHISINGLFPSDSIPDSCTLAFDTVIAIPLVPHMSTTYSCDSTDYSPHDTIATTLNDISDYISGMPPTYWDWLVNGTTVSHLQNPKIVLAPGTYLITLGVGYGSATCFVSDSITVPARPLPNFTDQDSVCEGNPVLFLADTSWEINSYLWNFDDGSQSALNPTERTYYIPDLPIVTSKDYNVTLTIHDIYGCTESETKTIVVFKNKFLGGELNPSVTLCSGGTVTISITGSVGGTSPLSYIWSNGATSSSISVSQTGNYSVTITDAHGCHESVGPVPEVFQQPPTPQILGQQTYCWNDNVNLTIDEGPGYSYSWIVKGPYIPSPIPTGPNFISPATDPSNPGKTFNNDTIWGVVTTIGGLGCADTSAPVIIHVHPKPHTPYLIPSSLCLTNGPVTIYSLWGGLPYSVYWSNGQIGTSITVATPGSYSAWAIDSFNCTSDVYTVGINAGADFSQLISGCFYECNQDTLTIPGPVYNTGDSGYTFQWLLNGVPVTSEATNSQDLYPVTAPGGSYQLIVTTPAGCTDTSNPITIHFHPCPDSPTHCCCCSYVAYITDSIYCAGNNISGHAMYDFSAYIYYPDSPSRVILTSPWGYLSNVTYVKDSTGILYHGRFTNTTDTTADFCVKWQVVGLNGLDSCSVTSCHQLPSCITPCSLSAGNIIGQSCQEGLDTFSVTYDTVGGHIDTIYHTRFIAIKLAVIHFNYSGTQSSPIVFTNNGTSVLNYQSQNTVSNGSEILYEFVDSGYVPNPTTITATVYDSIFGVCTLTFQMDTACDTVVQMGSCGIPISMTLDSCVGHDSLGNPIVHYTITVTNPSSTTGEVYIQSQNTGQVTVLNDTLYPFTTTYFSGIFDDTASTGSTLFFVFNIVNMQGDTVLCTDSVYVPNANPCRGFVSCDSTVGYDALNYCVENNSDTVVQVLSLYINYPGIPGSPYSIVSTVSGIYVVPFDSSQIITHGSIVQEIIYNINGYTGPDTLTVTIYDSINGSCSLRIPVDSGCVTPVLDSCMSILTYAMILDSCVGYDSLGYPIVSYTMTVNNPLPVASSILIESLNNQVLGLTFSTHVINAGPGSTIITGTFIDTANVLDSLQFVTLIAYGSSVDTFCGYQLSVQNNIPCQACPTVELLEQQCEYNPDDSVLETDFFYYINWNGANYTPLTVTSTCSGVGANVIYPAGSPVLMNPGSYFVVSVTDTIPYADSCTLNFSVPGGCHLSSTISQLDTCIVLENNTACDTLVPSIVLDSCIGMDTVTGDPIFSYTININDPFSTFSSFLIVPESPTVNFTVDSCNMPGGPYQGTFEQGGSTSPIYLTYIIIFFDVKGNEVCSETIHDTLTSPCSRGEYGIVKMFLYPNPTGTTSTLVYQIDGDVKTDKIVVTDLLGNTLMSFDNLEQKGSLILNSEALAPSIYLVTLYQHDKPLITDRWVVVR